jgi:hypothetical protein
VDGLYPGSLGAVGLVGHHVRVRTRGIGVSQPPGRESDDDADRLGGPFELDAQPQPVCAELTPFTIVDADRASGAVTLSFAPQPAFRNPFGHVQGGFAVATAAMPGPVP